MHHLGPQVAEPRTAFRRGRDRGQLGAGRDGQLGDVVADAPRSAGQQHPPPGQGARRAQQPQRGDPGQRERRRPYGVDAVGEDGEGVRGHGRVLGPAALRRMPDHPGPDAGTRAVRGGLDDQPRDVLAGQQPRTGAFEEERLAPVRRERLDLHQRLVGLRNRLGHFGERDRSRRVSRGNQSSHDEDATSPATPRSNNERENPTTSGCRLW